jgi:hypothetical protein
MSDKDLIELMAKTWVENGGDYEGFVYCSQKILDKIYDIGANDETTNHS